jgi:hypothetical protein
MNIPFLVAGAMAAVAAGIHGIAGDAILRRIDVGALPGSRFGSPRGTGLMIRVSWHMVTSTFAVLGVALLVCGLDDAREGSTGIGILAASAFSVFAAMAIAGGLRRGPRFLLRHPGPPMLAAIAALAWWGAAGV